MGRALDNVIKAAAPALWTPHSYSKGDANVSSLVFTGLAGARSVRLDGWVRPTVNDAIMFVQLSQDGGNTWIAGGNYGAGFLYGDGASTISSYQGVTLNGFFLAIGSRNDLTTDFSSRLSRSAAFTRWLSVGAAFYNALSRENQIIRSGFIAQAASANWNALRITPDSGSIAAHDISCEYRL